MEEAADGKLGAGGESSMPFATRHGPRGERPKGFRPFPRGGGPESSYDRYRGRLPLRYACVSKCGKWKLHSLLANSWQGVAGLVGFSAP